MCITALTVKMWELCVKVSPSTISVFMHTDGDRELVQMEREELVSGL